MQNFAFAFIVAVALAIATPLTLFWSLVLCMAAAYFFAPRAKGAGAWREVSLDGGAPGAGPAFRREPIPEEDNPDVRRLRDALEAGNFAPAQEFLEKTSDPDERAFYVSALSNWKGRPPFLDRWAAAYPESGIPLTVRGRHGVRWAWEARGSGSGDQVSDSAAMVFFARLEEAEADFERAAALDPSDPTPLAGLLITARGLEAGKDEERERFEKVKALAPRHWEAHVNMLSCVTKKWGGSHEEMFKLARDARRGAPAGCAIHALIGLAHMERWLYPAAFEDDWEAAKLYIQSSEVRAELSSAYGKLVGTGGEGGRNVYIKECLNIFAFCFALADDWDEGRDAFGRLGPKDYRDTPWKILEGRKLFDKERARFLADPK